MITQENINHKGIYRVALKAINQKRPLHKKLFQRSFSLEEASHLKELTLSNIEINNLDFLQYFQGLTILNLLNITGLSDISGLRYCPELKELEIYNTNVDDFSEVQSLKKLTYFGYSLDEEYEAYAKEDFSFLKNLVGLEVLCITGNRLKDVSVFSALVKVKHLTLEKNPITTIAPLKNMKDLNSLEVEYCCLSSLDCLNEFPALKVVLVKGNDFNPEQIEYYHSIFPNIEIDFDN